MKIDNEFKVGIPIDEAWKVLTDLEGIAPCLPGAQLTGVDGDDFKGKVKIKVGPVVSEYAGIARFIAKDDATYHATIDAKGKDSRGNGNASAIINATLRADGDSTIVSVDTDLNITGKIAQFGSGMIKEVSAKLLGQFADNLEAKLLAPAQVPAAAPVAEPAPVGSADTAATSTAVAAAPVVAPARTFTPTAEAEPLDLLAIAGSSVSKRVIPVVAVALLAIVVIIFRRRAR
jgi:carbon monoxide dehydrogenase subunit G